MYQLNVIIFQWCSCKNVLACDFAEILLVRRSCDTHDMIFVVKKNQLNCVDLLVICLSNWHKSCRRKLSWGDLIQHDLIRRDLSQHQLIEDEL